MHKTPTLQIVILAGGTGTRLWPLSRAAKPKQFQALVGEETLFQNAVKRARLVTSWENIFIATGAKYVAEIRKQNPKLLAKNIVVEPAYRNTAAALGYAATVLAKRNPDGVMAVLYADHLITKAKEFVRKLRAAANVAATGKLVIVEVKSLYPATQYGWVQIGKKIDEVEGEEVFAFQKFTEKPNLKTAEKFHRAGNYLWNTGLYVWQTKTILEKIRTHLPTTARRLEKIGARLHDKHLIEREYSACENISIDYGVMEKVAPSEVAIIPAELGWNDIGNWASLKDELSKKEANLVEGAHLGIDTRGCLIRGNEKKLIATIGLENFIIVDTPDALLICPKSESGRVGEIVKKIEGRFKKLI